jgi:hypothetical protein
MTNNLLKYHIDGSKNNSSIILTDRNGRITGWAFVDSANDVAQDITVYVNGVKSGEDVFSMVSTERNNAVTTDKEEIRFCGCSIDLSGVKQKEFETELQLRTKKTHLQHSAKCRI